MQRRTYIRLSQNLTDMEKEEELKYIVITDKKVTVCGQSLEHEQTGAAMLSEIYRTYIGDWPKFFKMDTLSKVGYLASELLLKDLGDCRMEGEECTSGRAIVLFGTTASLCADHNYQETIQNEDNYYPSPALFVYTLPNIVTGEIAIRNHYRGETEFLVVERFDAMQMAFHVQCAFQDKTTESVLVGWIDSTDNDDFSSFFTLVDGEGAKDRGRLAQQLDEIMNNLKY